MTAPILLSTLGSAGDLVPVLELARALEAQGQPARLALGPSDALRAREEGLDALAFGPSDEEVSALLDLDRDGLAAQVFRDASPILSKATYPMLADLARQLLPEARAARAVCATILAMAAPLAAEAAGRPFVPLLLQPMLMRSALDPPRVRGFSPPMAAAPRSALARAWNRAWLAVIATEFRRRHGRDETRVRRELDLPPSRHLPVFEQARVATTIGLWDPAFAPAPPDRARGLVLTGFPRPAAQPLPPDLEHFLAAGPPPMVVTLGSVAHALGGGGFWSGAVGLAREAGLRAVLLSGSESVPEGPDIYALPFASHDALFPRAAVILHHGGIGTTGAACLSGRPQLVQPLGADQPDNAARVARHGLGRIIRRPGSAAAALRAVLSPATAATARDFARGLEPDGAGRAADALLAALP